MPQVVGPKREVEAAAKTTAAVVTVVTMGGGKGAIPRHKRDGMAARFAMAISPTLGRACTQDDKG